MNKLINYSLKNKKAIVLYDGLINYFVNLTRLNVSDNKDEKTDDPECFSVPILYHFLISVQLKNFRLFDYTTNLAQFQ